MDNNNFNQNSENNQNQNPYEQNQYNANYNTYYQQQPNFNASQTTEQADAKAKTAFNLSIWAFVTSLICCDLPAIVLAIISLVFVSQSKNLNGGNLLPKAKTARGFAIAALIIAIVLIIVSNILSAMFREAIMDWASSMSNF